MKKEFKNDEAGNTPISLFIDKVATIIFDKVLEEYKEVEIQKSSI